MSTKVKELDNRVDGNRERCNICRKLKKDEVSMSALWEWQRRNPGKRAFK